LRVLITGASGFAGGHLARKCAAAGDEVVGLSRSAAPIADLGEGLAVDLRDAEAARDAVGSVRPDVLYHLAALSHVGRAWEEPTQTVMDNVSSAINVLEAVRHAAPRTRVVWVSSCEVYGAPERLPVEESAPLRPANPYAVSKSAGDLLAEVYANAHGLDIVRARPFNHAGPGQQPIFIVSSLARQAAQARLVGAPTVQIVTGNPHTRRDFTDVRDVVDAYRLLAERAEPGVYNVSSGHSISAGEQVSVLSELLAPLGVRHEVDHARVRAHEVMDLRGANGRIAAATGWRPKIPFEQTMRDTIQWWERELSRAAPRSSMPH
jgi:GDP-4-dehydro-6-deoxy-D-mannose reductase